jgi:hypothetical protein
VAASVGHQSRASDDRLLCGENQMKAARYATFVEYDGSAKTSRTAKYDNQTGLFA